MFYFTSRTGKAEVIFYTCVLRYYKGLRSKMRSLYELPTTIGIVKLATVGLFSFVFYFPFYYPLFMNYSIGSIKGVNSTVNTLCDKKFFYNLRIIVKILRFTRPNFGHVFVFTSFRARVYVCVCVSNRSVCVCCV